MLLASPPLHLYTSLKRWGSICYWLNLDEVFLWRLATLRRFAESFWHCDGVSMQLPIPVKHIAKGILLLCDSLIKFDFIYFFRRALFSQKAETDWHKNQYVDGGRIMPIIENCLGSALLWHWQIIIKINQSLWRLYSNSPDWINVRFGTCRYETWSALSLG